MLSLKCFLDSTSFSPSQSQEMLFAQLGEESDASHSTFWHSLTTEFVTFFSNMTQIIRVQTANSDHIHMLTFVPDMHCYT